MSGLDVPIRRTMQPSKGWSRKGGNGGRRRGRLGGAAFSSVRRAQMFHRADRSTLISA
ncbi:MAG: hypothetical protein AAED33_13510 [Paracoccaceae bacterium]